MVLIKISHQMLSQKNKKSSLQELSASRTRITTLRAKNIEQIEEVARPANSTEEKQNL